MTLLRTSGQALIARAQGFVCEGLTRARRPQAVQHLVALLDIRDESHPRQRTKVAVEDQDAIRGAPCHAVSTNQEGPPDRCTHKGMDLAQIEKIIRDRIEEIRVLEKTDYKVRTPAKMRALISLQDKRDELEGLLLRIRAMASIVNGAPPSTYL